MTVTTTLVIGDPVDAYELFAHARTVLGLPLDGRWHLVDHGSVHMLQTLPEQGVSALASVHFPVTGGRHPGEPDAGIPGGYVLLAFTSDGGGDARTRHWHRDLAGRTGAWLTARRLRWDLVPRRWPLDRRLRPPRPAGGDPMTYRPFELLVTGTTDEYRLDVVTDPEPDNPQAVVYFTATNIDAATRQAERLLAVVDGPDDRYGELYCHDGDGTAVFCDTIHLPA